MNRSVFRSALLLFLCIASLLPLSSCGQDGLMHTLGFDTHNYRGEKVIAVHAPDSTVVQSLLPLIDILNVSSPYLKPFSGPKEAAETCRDAILARMLEDSYAKYAGNTALLNKAAQDYPHLQLNIIIPADDFEAVVYATFGGSEKISNRNGEHFFRYLSEIDAYTTVGTLQQNTVETTVLSCEETERTYRLTFRRKAGETVSPPYCALLIKREDGTVYIKELTDASD